MPHSPLLFLHVYNTLDKNNVCARTLKCRIFFVCVFSLGGGRGNVEISQKLSLIIIIDQEFDV